MHHELAICGFLPRDAMHSADMPSKNVHPSHGGIVLKRINLHVYHQTFLHQSGSHTILAFPYQTFTGTSPNGDNRMSWSADSQMLNRFRMEQGHCSACRRKWQLSDTDLCPCGKTQTMSRIVESCPLTKLNGGLSRLHSADEDAVSWLTSYG